MNRNNFFSQIFAVLVCSVTTFVLAFSLMPFVDVFLAVLIAVSLVALQAYAFSLLSWPRRLGKDADYENTGAYIPPFYLKEADEHYHGRGVEYAVRFGFFDGELEIFSDGMSPIPDGEITGAPRCGHYIPEPGCIGCRGL